MYKEGAEHALVILGLTKQALSPGFVTDKVKQWGAKQLAAIPSVAANQGLSAVRAESNALHSLSSNASGRMIRNSQVLPNFSRNTQGTQLVAPNLAMAGRQVSPAREALTSGLFDVAHATGERNHGVMQQMNQLKQPIL